MSETLSLNTGTEIDHRPSKDLSLDALLSIERQVQRFRDAHKSLNINLQQYLDGLPSTLHEPAVLELMFEFLQQQQEDRNELIAACKDQLGSGLIPDFFRISQNQASEDSENDWPQIGGYEIENVLGNGGTAIVFKATQRNPHRTVALKVPRQHEDGFDRLILQRFYSEARLQSKYLGSGVPAVFEFGMSNAGVPFISMELVEGKSLESFFKVTRGTFDSQRDGIRLIAKICRALAPIHADGNSHLDLSPSNVFIKPDGQVKILDFGFGHDTSQSRQRLEAAGTPCYMAPEKARGDSSKFSIRTDVFSIGAFLARMITCEHLLPANISNEAKLDRIARGDFSAALDRVRRAHSDHGVPLALINLTLQCLSIEPQDRPSDASAVAEQIEDYFRSEEVELQRLQVQNATQRARNQIMYPAIATVLGVLLLATIVSVRYAVVAESERQTANTEKVRSSRNANLRFAALDDVVRLVADDSLRRAGQTQLQRVLLERVRPRIEDVLAFEEKDEATRAQQGLAWNSLSVIRQSMHEFAEALAAACKAENILRELCELPSATPATKLAMAISLSNQAALLGQSGNLADGIAKAEEATKRLNELIEIGEEENNIGEVFYRAALAENNWALCLYRAEQPTEALTHFKKAAERIDTVIKLRPSEIVYRAWRAKLLSNLVDFFQTSGKLDEAAPYAKQSVLFAQQLYDDLPKSVDSRECLAVCLTNSGLLALQTESPIDSLPEFEKALELYSSLYAQVPEYGEYKWGTAMAASNLAAVLMSGPRPGWADAKKHLDNAKFLYEELNKSMQQNADLKPYIDLNNSRIIQLQEMLTQEPNEAE